MKRDGERGEDRDGAREGEGPPDGPELVRVLASDFARMVLALEAARRQVTELQALNTAYLEDGRRALRALDEMRRQRHEEWQRAYKAELYDRTLRDAETSKGDPLPARAEPPPETKRPA